MPTIRLHETTTSTPEQFVAGLTEVHRASDYGAGLIAASIFLDVFLLLLDLFGGSRE
jgi:hypothetical protein